MDKKTSVLLVDSFRNATIFRLIVEQQQDLINFDPYVVLYFLGLTYKDTLYQTENGDFYVEYDKWNIGNKWGENWGEGWGLQKDKVSSFKLDTSRYNPLTQLGLRTSTQTTMNENSIKVVSFDSDPVVELKTSLDSVAHSIQECFMSKLPKSKIRSFFLQAAGNREVLDSMQTVISNFVADTRSFVFDSLTSVQTCQLGRSELQAEKPTFWG